MVKVNIFKIRENYIVGSFYNLLNADLHIADQVYRH